MLLHGWTFCSRRFQLAAACYMLLLSNSAIAAEPTALTWHEDYREACDAAGMAGFLTKPLDRERLATTLLELTARRSLAA